MIEGEQLKLGIYLDGLAFRARSIALKVKATPENIDDLHMELVDNWRAFLARMADQGLLPEDALYFPEEGERGKVLLLPKQGNGAG